MKITEIQRRRYEARLQELKDEEPKLQEQVMFAKELGDFSENSELDSARADLNNNNTEQSYISNLLESSEIVSYNDSALITQGSMVEVTCPAYNNGEKLVLLVSDSGDSLLEGVLNTKSALGKQVLGNVDGEFEVNGNTFFVRKIPKPNIDDFIAKYPSLSEGLKRYFDSNLELVEVNKENDSIDGQQVITPSDDFRLNPDDSEIIDIDISVE